MKSYLVLALGLTMLFVLLSVNTASAQVPYYHHRAPYVVGGVSVDVRLPGGGHVVYRGNNWNRYDRYYRVPDCHYHGSIPYHRPFVRHHFR